MKNFILSLILRIRIFLLPHVSRLLVPMSPTGPHSPPLSLTLLLLILSSYNRSLHFLSLSSRPCYHVPGIFFLLWKRRRTLWMFLLSHLCILSRLTQLYLSWADTKLVLYHNLATVQHIVSVSFEYRDPPQLRWAEAFVVWVPRRIFACGSWARQEVCFTCHHLDFSHVHHVIRVTNFVSELLSHINSYVLRFFFFYKTTLANVAVGSYSSKHHVFITLIILYCSMWDLM